MSYLREFARNLPANANGPIAEFREQAGSSRLWRIASQSDKVQQVMSGRQALRFDLELTTMDGFET